MRIITTTLLVLALTGACSRDADQAKSGASMHADIIFRNGYIYTVDSARTVATAVALNKNRIVYVGNDAGTEELQGKRTKVIDLNGRMMLPGMHDVHIHPFGIIDIDQCDLKSEPFELEEMVAYLQQCLQRYNPEPGEWLTVDQWNYSFGNTPTERFPNIRTALDAVSMEHPIMLLGNDGHHAAVNSAALLRARNLTGDTVPLDASSLNQDYSGCRVFIGVDKNGEPDGAVNEKARLLFDLSLFDIWGGSTLTTGDMPRIAMRLARSGITSVMDAAALPEQLPLYASLHETGKQTYRLTAALFADPNTCLSPRVEPGVIDSIVAEFSDIRETYRSHPFIKADTAKMFIDGVAEGNPLATPPTLPNAASLVEYKQPVFSIDMENETAEITGYVDTDSQACVEYRNAPDKYQSANSVAEFTAQNAHLPGQCLKSRGVYENPLEYMQDYAQALYRDGFYIHAHAIGDRAFRTALDIFAALDDIEAVKKARMSITHAQYIHPDDIHRTGELGVSVAFTYSWSAPGLLYDLSTIPFIDRVDGVSDLYNETHYAVRQYYPANSIKQAGGYLTAGSDAPVESRDPRPFINMAVAVSRSNEEGQVLNAAERISMDAAIAAYTINGARQLHQDDRVGSIENGKLADLIVLNRNIIELYSNDDYAAIADTKVVMTVFDGKIIYRE